MEKYILAFLKCRGVGNVKLLNYLKKYKMNINDIISNKREIINEEDSISFEEYVSLAEDEILKNKQNGINITSILNDSYPIKLIEIKDPILYLYYKGNISLINKPSIAIIGSRNIDEKDKTIIGKISKYISSKDITVVSGLAMGSDTYAHIGSYKERGHTISILPSGIDVVTPASNKKLVNEILRNEGLIISEYSSGVTPTKYTYVKRDRIQAALSDAVIVVKASEKSGTMHAVKIAQESKKYVAQYKDNINNLILNYFESKEDIDKIIAKVKQRKHGAETKKIYEQKCLF